MIVRRPAKKLTIYVDETDKYAGKPVYETLMDVFRKKGIAGVTLFKGLAGYGADGVLHTARILELSVKLPVKVEAVDTEDKIESVLPDVYQIVEKGLVEISDTSVIRGFPQHEEKPQHKRRKTERKGRLLIVNLAEDDKWEGEPLYEALLKRFIIEGIAGASVYKGIAGYGEHKHLHKARFVLAGGGIPVAITVIDSETNINRALAIIEDMASEAIVAISDVDTIEYTWT